MSVKNAIEVKGGTNGLKTILGAVVIVIAGQLGIVADLIDVYPDNSTLESVAKYLEIGLEYAEYGLKLAGSSILSWGVTHKLIKLFR